MDRARFESWKQRLIGGEENHWIVYEMCKFLRESNSPEFQSLGHIGRIKHLQKLLPDVSVRVITVGYIEYASSAWNSLPPDSSTAVRGEEFGQARFY